MKLNFWQWLGILIVAIALIFIIRRELGPATPKPTNSTPPATTSPTP
jgi:hypothetical protein